MMKSRGITGLAGTLRQSCIGFRGSRCPSSALPLVDLSFWNNYNWTRIWDFNCRVFSPSFLLLFTSSSLLAGSHVWSIAMRTCRREASSPSQVQFLQIDYARISWPLWWWDGGLVDNVHRSPWLALLLVGARRLRSRTACLTNDACIVTKLSRPTPLILSVLQFCIFLLPNLMFIQ